MKQLLLIKRNIHLGLMAFLISSSGFASYPEAVDEVFERYHDFFFQIKGVVSAGKGDCLTAPKATCILVGFDSEKAMAAAVSVLKNPLILNEVRVDFEFIGTIEGNEAKKKEENLEAQPEGKPSETKSILNPMNPLQWSIYSHGLNVAQATQRYKAVADLVPIYNALETDRRRVETAAEGLVDAVANKSSMKKVGIRMRELSDAYYSFEKKYNNFKYGKGYKPALLDAFWNLERAFDEVELFFEKLKIPY